MTASEREPFEEWAARGSLVSDSGNLASLIAAETLRDVSRDRAFRAAETRC